MFYKKVARRALFELDAERSHELGLMALRACGANPLRRLLSGMTYVSGNEVEVFGLKFPNPVGLAAGFEKNAVALAGICALSPGFVEVGTVVPQPQSGNPRPRMFRLKEDKGLINRMGFNSDGAACVEERFERFRAHNPGIPIGVNIGANKNTPTENAYLDYVAVLTRLYKYASYLTVNVSSPNTPGLRQLQHGEYLNTLLTAVMEAVRLHGGVPKPILLKIAPDLLVKELDEICDVASALGISGLIIGNTTLSRKGIRSANQNEAGGLSGRPLFPKMLSLVRHVHDSGVALPIVAAGGIASVDDVRLAQDAGASLVQLLTALVYEGPMIFRNINRELAR